MKIVCATRTQCDSHTLTASFFSFVSIRFCWTKFNFQFFFLDEYRMNGSIKSNQFVNGCRANNIDFHWLHRVGIHLVNYCTSTLWKFIEPIDSPTRLKMSATFQKPTINSDLWTDEAVPLSTPMRDFYRGKVVFLTGGTGFLGQIYVEKLLRWVERIGREEKMSFIADNS